MKSAIAPTASSRRMATSASGHELERLRNVTAGSDVLCRKKPRLHLPEEAQASPDVIRELPVTQLFAGLSGAAGLVVQQDISARAATSFAIR